MRSDGLVGMWAFTTDDNGDLEHQFEIERRTGDGYVVLTYSLETGRMDGRIVIPRKRILERKVYLSVYGMNAGIDEYENKRRRPERSVVQERDLRVVT